MGSRKIIRPINRAVFLDRDGVINQAIVREGKPYPPSLVSEVVIPEGAESALNKLNDAGFLLVGITNQPDVARGTQQEAVVEEINRCLMDKFPITEIFVCYHDDSDNCDCRKPKPGLFFQAAEKYEIDLSNSYMIGDRWKDVEAGQNAGCNTILIDFTYNEKQPSSITTIRVTSLVEASLWILNNELWRK